MPEAYKNHRVGSAIGAIHKVFDEKGKEAAKKKGESLGLQPHSVRSAISCWERKVFSRAAPTGKRAKKGKKVARVARATKTGKVAKAARKARPAKRPAKKVTKVAKVARVPRPAKKASPTAEAA